MYHGCDCRQLRRLKSRYDSTPQLPFSKCLRQEAVESLAADLGVLYRDRIYTPCVTLWILLSQVLSADHSCRDAVARYSALRIANGQPACSTDTGSYCQARQRLPEELLSGLTQQTGQELHEQAPPEWRLHGRPVKMVDGAVVSMPDTPQNEACFGKSQNQHGQMGFPLARIVVLLCLATGAVLEMAIGPYQGKRSGELSLFRSLQDRLRAGDILLGDRLFGTYSDIARLAALGVDVVFRLHANRKADFRRGCRLGTNDHLVTWHKPTRRPQGVSPEEFAALPKQLTLRELRVRVATRGFRVKSFVVVTTLTDPEAFPAKAIAALYRQRWHAELDLRSIKSVMQMDVLRCTTPQMVRTEIWAHALAYNLLRNVMCQTAQEYGIPVRELSFKGTLQLFNAFHLLIIISKSDDLEAICAELMKAIRTHRVGQRPNRYEPRKRKRAAKPYPSMKHPRWEERKRCLAQ